MKGSKVLADRTSPWEKNMLCFFSSTSFEPTSRSSLRMQVSGDKGKQSSNSLEPSVTKISAGPTTNNPRLPKRSSAFQAFIATPTRPGIIRQLSSGNPTRRLHRPKGGWYHPDPRGLTDDGWPRSAATSLLLVPSRSLSRNQGPDQTLSVWFGDTRIFLTPRYDVQIVAS